MGSPPLKRIVHTWQHFHLFFKACTKDYVVNLCLANPDNEAAIQQPAAQTYNHKYVSTQARGRIGSHS